MPAEATGGSGLVVRSLAVLVGIALVAVACSSADPSPTESAARGQQGTGQVDCDGPCSWSEADPAALDRSIDALVELAERHAEGADADDLVAHLDSVGAERIVAEEWGIEFAFPGGLVVAHLSEAARGAFGEPFTGVTPLDDLVVTESDEAAAAGSSSVSSSPSSEMVPVTWDPAGEPNDGVRVLVLEPYRYEDPQMSVTAGDAVRIAAEDAPDKVRHLEHRIDEAASLEVFRSWNQWDVIVWLSHGTPRLMAGAEAAPYLELKDDDRGWGLRDEIEPGITWVSTASNPNVHLAFSAEFFLDLPLRDDQVIYLGLCDSATAWASLEQPNSTVFGWDNRVPSWLNQDVASILGDLLFVHGYSTEAAYTELRRLGLGSWFGRVEGELVPDWGGLVVLGEARRGRDTITLRNRDGQVLLDGMTVAIDGIPDDGRFDVLLIDFLLAGVPPETIDELRFTILLDGDELETEIELVDTTDEPTWLLPHHPRSWVGTGRARLNRDLRADDIGRLHDLRIEVEDATPGPTAHQVQIAMGPCYWSGVLGGAELGEASGRVVGISQTGGFWQVYLGQVRAEQPGTSVLLGVDGDPTEVSTEDLVAGAWISTRQFLLASEDQDRTSRVRITHAEPGLIVGGVAASAGGLALDFETFGTVTFDGIFVWSPACPTTLELLLDR